MFTETDDTTLTILKDGKVNVTVIKRYYKDGTEIGNENWGCCLEPTNVYKERARMMLSDYHMNILNAVWTPEIIEAYALEHSAQGPIGPVE